MLDAHFRRHGLPLQFGRGRPSRLGSTRARLAPSLQPCKTCCRPFSALPAARDQQPRRQEEGAQRATPRGGFPAHCDLPLGRARPRAPSGRSRSGGGEGMANGVARGSPTQRPPLALLLSGAFLCLTCWSPPQPASAQPAAPCQAPLQWEGRTVVYDHSTGRNTRAAVTYDGSNQRLRILEERKGLIPCKKFFEYIYLYKDAVMFQIEQVTKLCSKVALSEPWDPYDIPDNSTYEDQYYIGGPGDQIMVQEWSDRKPARKLENWVGVYTVKDCYPVQETYTKNYSVTTSTRFFDLTLGISDPSVFIPPSTCQTAQPKRMRDEC